MSYAMDFPLQCLLGLRSTAEGDTMEINHKLCLYPFTQITIAIMLVSGLELWPDNIVQMIQMMLLNSSVMHYHFVMLILLENAD